MEKQNIVVYRSPQNKTKRIFIFNSSVNYNDKQIIIYQRPAEVDEPFGYCIIFKRDHYIINRPPNYHSPTRRSFLNECIRQIYLLAGLADTVRWTPSTNLMTREEIWHLVNMCLQPAPMTPFHEMVQRVKRQLFREPQSKRKQSNPRRGKEWGTQILNYRSLRPKIGRRSVRRGYLKNGRQLAISQLIRENIKRDYSWTTPVSSGFNPFLPHTEPADAADGIYNANANVLLNIWRYHHNNARHHQAIERKMTPSEVRVRYNEACRLTWRAKRLEAMFIHEQIRRSLQTHHIILEESVRSMFFAKQLFRLVEDHEEFIYSDNRILARPEAA